MSGPILGARRRRRRATSHSSFSIACSAEQLEPLERRALLSGGSPPQVVSAEFRFETPPHAVVLRFDQNVGPSLGSDDLALINVDTGQIYFGADIEVEFREKGFLATFTFPAFEHKLLADGNYRALLHAGSVSGPDGLPLENDFSFKFRFLRGDANGDGTVDLRDFNVLAGNFGRTDGATFTQGDFDYDGNVDLEDFNLLVSRFGTSIA